MCCAVRERESTITALMASNAGRSRQHFTQPSQEMPFNSWLNLEHHVQSVVQAHVFQKSRRHGRSHLPVWTIVTHFTCLLQPSLLELQLVQNATARLHHCCFSFPFFLLSPYEPTHHRRSSSQGHFFFFSFCEMEAKSFP